MIKAVLASRNQKKIAEMRTLLSETLGGELELLSLDDIGFEGDIVEDGSSFEENSVIKAAAVAKLGYIGIADDSGLSVDALGGDPGIYSARYSCDQPDTGEPRDVQNNAKLLRALDGTPDERRGASFICTVACVFPVGSCMDEIGKFSSAVCDLPEEVLKRAENMKVFAVRGEFRGVIARKPSGSGGFGYDPLFYLPEYGMTSAEIPPEEKNRISHRGKAVRAFAGVFASIIKDIKD